ncbi:efflux RND transporter periplasmic adaptor subunit [Pseudooceanicola sp. LIPI14-2-Ac024]|uniref:efflux RND transporter periplasmic adaptor subunit n=1 Tax=Pseudooceanicola sp. LIPI14-2-Ac024 TaxID=3344875 RepID=UPI0035CFFB9D
MNVKVTTGEAPDEIAGDESVLLDTEIWARLGAAPSVEAFAVAWLDLQCRQMGGVRAATLLMAGPDGGQLSPVALRPADAVPSPTLVMTTERAASARRGIVRPAKDRSPAAFALPIVIDDALAGVVALELHPGRDVDANRVMRQLQWGAGWVEALVRRGHPGDRGQLVAILGLLSSAASEMKYKAAANSLAAELAHRLQCTRVSIGHVKRRTARTDAISNTATVKARSGLVQAISAAMDEAIEQQARIRIPSPEGTVTKHATSAHQALVAKGGSGAVLTVPLHVDADTTGAIVLERETPFPEADVALVEQLAALVAPSLEAKRLNDRWLMSKAAGSVGSGLRMVFGPRHMAWKLAAVAAACVVLVLVFATGQFRVSGDARLEGVVRRVVTSPMDGFIESAEVRPGDIVAAGQTLARLDDSELRLERVRWLSEKAQYDQGYRTAFVEGDLPEAQIIRAQIEGAEARLMLIDEQLARTEILAPFDGVVTSGDLTQSLGSPVGRGDVLFEVAPLDRYRVIVEVEEADIGFVEEGQESRIVLSAAPDRSFGFRVTKLTPVAEVKEGLNLFRVEGELLDLDEVMRPGMEGVAKIDIEDRRYAWIWTHRAIWWARMTLWKWWPNG